MHDIIFKNIVPEQNAAKMFLFGNTLNSNHILDFSSDLIPWIFQIIDLLPNVYYFAQKSNLCEKTNILC